MLILIKMFNFVIQLAVSINLDYTCSLQDNRFFYDTSLLECQECPLNQVSTDDGFACQCRPGTAKTVETRDSRNFECSPCTNGVPRSD